MDMIEAVRKELRKIESELTDVSIRKRELEVTKSVLEKVIACGGSTNAPAIQVPQYREMSTVDCVKYLLKQHPEGIPMSLLVDTLEGQIVSNSANKRRVLQNTVDQLQRARVVKKVTKGGKPLVVLNE